MCRYQEWDRERHKLRYCPANVVSVGLCQEHLEWVADCKAMEVSKLDQKYWYRVPGKRKAKLGPSTVVETILKPDTAGIALRKNFENATGKAKAEAFKALIDYQNKRALRINDERRIQGQPCR
jgi:hypothetical protein